MKSERGLPPGEIIKNTIGRDGVRYLHVIDRKEIEIAAWLHSLSWYARTSGEPVQSKAWQDESLGIWHLEMMWLTRDMITVRNTPRPEDGKQWVLMWWIGDAARLRDAIEAACEAFLGFADRIPERVYLRTKGGAPEVYEAWGQYPVKIGVLRWIPERFIVIA